MESVGTKIEEFRQKNQKLTQKAAQKQQKFEPETSAQSDVREFLTKNKKHHLKVKNEDEEFDLEDPSEYEKEAEDYTIDTLDAYSTAMDKHALAEKSVSSIVSEEEKAENLRKEQEAQRAKTDLENTLRSEKKAREKAIAKKKAEKSEEEEVLDIMNKQRKEDETETEIWDKDLKTINDDANDFHINERQQET